MQYVQNRIHAYKPGLSVPYDTAPLKQPQPMASFVLLSSLGWTVVTLLSGCPQYLLDKQEKVQNAATRLVEKSDHIHPTLQALHWLPVQKLSSIDSVLFLAHPLSICLRAVTIGTGHPTLCRASCKHRNVSFVKKSFSYAGPSVWNSSLPETLCHSDFSSSFKTTFKTQLFSNCPPPHPPPHPDWV